MTFGTLLGLLAACKAPGPPPACPEDASASDTGETEAATWEPPQRALVLLDSSGSMYPGYGESECGASACPASLTDKGPRRNGQSYYVALPLFQQLFTDWLAAASPSPLVGDLLLFNAGVYHVGTDSVTRLEEGTLPFATPLNRAEQWLSVVPKDPYQLDKDDKYVANITDTTAALRQALRLLEDDGIIWLFTDNIVDQPNSLVSADDADRNREFYNFIQENDQIKAAYVYPLHLSDSCSWMCGTSLMVYGLYVSSRNEVPTSALRQLGGQFQDDAPGLLWNPKLQAIAAPLSGARSGGELAGVPLRLKPVDRDVLSMEFVPSERGETVWCDSRVEYDQPLTCEATISVQNTLRHQEVLDLELTFSNDMFRPHDSSGKPLPWAGALCSGDLKLNGWRLGDNREWFGEPIEVGRLGPLESKALTIQFQLPPMPVAHQDVQELLQIALTDRVLLSGGVVAQARDVRTQLVIPTEGLQDVYGASELPAIFQGQDVASLQTEAQAQAHVRNNGQLLALLSLGLGGGIVGLISLVLLRFQNVYCTVYVDSRELVRLRMPRISQQKLVIRGKHFATARRGWGAPVRLAPAPGFALKGQGSGYLLTEKATQEEHAVEVKRGWS